MTGMFEADLAKASRCRAMTSTTRSCAAWPSDLPSLNVVPSISLSRTSLVGSGRLSRAISARAISDGATSSSLGALVVVRIYGLKREGGELFKKDFSKLLSLE